MYSFLGLVWGVEEPGYFFFSVSVSVIDFHSSSKAGTVGMGVGGQFLECNLGLSKKKRCAQLLITL